MREKKIHCGDEYMEVDIYPYTENQENVHKSGTRSKKQKVSAPKQRNLNDKNAKRYFTQLTNANFGEGDLHVTLTYKKKYLPSTIEGGKEVLNYLRRVKYLREKEGLPPMKYIVVTEYVVAKDNEDKPIRIHHHIIMNGGLDRDIVEELWSKRKKKGQKKGERIGRANADRLQPDENGVAALCSYLTKNPNGKRRWSPSQNLEKPWSRTNDHKYSRRQIEKLAKTPPDIAYWETRYKGWTLAKDEYAIRTEYNEITGWSIYLKLYRRE